MKSDDFNKPVYQVRSKNGGVLVEGSFEDMVKWLAANKIVGNDDMRRLGYAVFEKDELWGRVSDFPEFHHSDREGRRLLLEKRKSARSFMIAAAGVLLIGLGLIIWNQVWPRYVESTKVADSRRMAENAQKDAVERIESAVAKAARQVKETKDAAEKTVKEALFSAGVAKANAETLKSEALNEKVAAAKLSQESKMAVEQMKAELDKARAEAAAALKEKQKLAGDVELALSSIEETIRRRTESLTNKVAALNRDLRSATDEESRLRTTLNRINRTMPLLVKWKSGVIQRGKDFEYFNYSRSPLKLRFKVTLNDGSVKEKSLLVPVGGWFALEPSLHDDFKPGEKVTVSQEGQEGEVQYELEVYLCPGN